MDAIGQVCYNPHMRNFAFFRPMSLDFCGKSHTGMVDVGHSFGCKLSRCTYSGFCKDCPHVLVDIFSL